MEIKHTHPKSKSPDERAAQLKDIRNACISAIFIPIYCQKNVDVSLSPRERNVLHRIVVFDHLTTKFF